MVQYWRSVLAHYGVAPLWSSTGDQYWPIMEWLRYGPVLEISTGPVLERFRHGPALEIRTGPVQEGLRYGPVLEINLIYI